MSNKTDILRLTVDGMMCDGCARTVRDALENIPGVTPEQVVVGEPVEIRVDDPSVSQERILTAIKDAGYHPTIEAEA